jgi:hypothetical protein
MSCVICRRKYRSLELAAAVLTNAVTAMLEDLDMSAAQRAIQGL